MASQQLRWLGKIVQMEETHLLRKFIGVWRTNPHPVGQPQQTIQQMYLHALCVMGAIPTEDKEGKFAMWFPQATDDPNKWKRHKKLLTPNLIGQKDSADEQMRTNTNVAADPHI
eukprot:8443178-Ditylum_brightwellii.AAC.1